MNYTPIHSISAGGFELQAWGLLFAIAFALGITWAYLRTPVKLREITLNLGIINILAGVVGARLAFIIVYPSQFSSISEIFRVWDGGMISYGGLILGAFLSLAYLKRSHFSISQFIDILAPPIALAIAITRVGCFLNHCHLGKLTEMPWGIRFLAETRHPIALYYALSALVVLAILVISEKKCKLPKGNLGLMLAMLYPLGRLTADQFAQYQNQTITLTNNILLLVGIAVFSYLFFTRLKASTKEKCT